MRRFVRFQTSMRASNSALKLGLFYSADKLLNSESLHYYWEALLRDMFDWFNRHLPAPRLRQHDPHIIFWFRAECHELICKMWRLAGVLKANGVDVELVHTTKPGRVFYEDSFQVAAIPWKR